MVVDFYLMTPSSLTVRILTTTAGFSQNSLSVKEMVA